jgi:CHAD domain-containing protein
VSTVEREIKLGAPDGFQLPTLDDADAEIIAAAEDTAELQATYFDTADLRLSRAGASLRHRNDEGWLVKLAQASDGSMLVRAEHHVGANSGNGARPPDDALDLVRALTRNASVAPVATLHTTRHRIALTRPDASPVGEVVDDHVEVHAPESDTVVGRFRELEVELADGATDADRLAVLARLRDAGAGSADPTPKIVRALGPVARAPADVVVPRVGHHADVETVVTRAIAAAVARLLAHDPGVRIGDDPEAVHQARVATRRLRSDLRTFRSLVDEQWANALRDELRWLGDVLGVVRDADVLIERLETKVAALPQVDRIGAEQIIDRLRADRERARDQLLRALRSERYDLLLDRLVAAAQRPRLLLRIDHDDASVLRALVRRPWKRLQDAVDALPPDPPDTDLHQVRIKAKRARYATEAVELAFGKPARAFARALVRVQDVLGDHQDAVIAEEWLRRTATEGGNGNVGFAAGQLASLEREAAKRARDAWPDAWAHASQKRLRHWL